MKKSRKKPLHPFVIKLGAEIKKLRSQKKLPLEILGAEIGLDASNMQKIELGQNLTLNTLLKLCIGLKIAPSKLFDKIPWNLTEEDIDALTTPRAIRKKIAKKGKRRG